MFGVCVVGWVCLMLVLVVYVEMFPAIVIVVEVVMLLVLFA